MTSRLLEIQQLTLKDHSTHRTLLHPLSFHINMGERVALVGESGSGKSLTALSIPGLLPSGINVEQGHIIWKDNIQFNDLTERERRQFRGRDIGMVFQDPLHALDPVMSVGAQLIEVLRRHKVVPNEQCRDEAIKRLKEVELPTPDRLLEAYPCHLSGGQQQRIMIAMAMAARPALLIADEPTTALDPLTQQYVLSLLEHVRTQHNTGLLFISHDLRLVERWADRVLVLEQGHLRESALTSEIFSSPKHSYTQRLINARPQRADVLEHRSEILPPAPSHPILSLEKVSVDVNSGSVNTPLNKKRAAFHLAPTNLSLFAGHSIGLIGGSGSGKTTLARLIMGLLKPHQGTISYCGTPISSLDSTGQHNRRRDIQMIFQNPYASLNPSWSIESILREPLQLMGLSENRTKDRIRIQEALTQVELDNSEAILRRRPSDFSGGQRQRLALARALLLKPKILVCDEATSALDASIQADIIKLLQHLKKEHGLGLVVIAHDLAMVAALADEVLVMHQGNVVEKGSVKDVLGHPSHSITQELCAASDGKPLSEILESR